MHACKNRKKVLTYKHTERCGRERRVVASRLKLLRLWASLGILLVFSGLCPQESNAPGQQSEDCRAGDGPTNVRDARHLCAATGAIYNRTQIFPKVTVTFPSLQVKHQQNESSRSMSGAVGGLRQDRAPDLRRVRRQLGLRDCEIAQQDRQLGGALALEPRQLLTHAPHNHLRCGRLRLQVKQGLSVYNLFMHARRNGLQHHNSSSIEGTNRAHSRTHAC